MRHYEYLPLEDEASIRLMTIFPGQFYDPFRAEIRHELLIPPGEIGHTRLSAKEVSQTLPPDWEVHETLEGRLLFRNRDTGRTSWTHPNPDVDSTLYDPSLDDSTDTPVPVYEALSYAWGSPEKGEMIEIEVSMIMDENMSRNISACRHLPITRNLAIALRHVRLRDRPRTLWIDAICIDQSNIQERSAQVQRMGEIFSSARDVVAWLGPSFTSSRLALNTLRRIGEQLELSNTTFHNFPAPHWFGHDGQVALAQLPSMDELDAIAQLCKVPYMSRLWVVQELVLASAKSVVKCGDDELPWPLFRRAMLRFSSWVDSIPVQAYQALSPVIAICLTQSALSLPTLLYNHHGRGCADARDKVYACMNLLDPALRQHIVADYSKSVLDVFKEVFLEFLGREERLEQLPYAGICTLPASDWPTWLPDWSERVSILLYHVDQASSISAAGANYIAPNKLQVNGLSSSHISIGGKILGTDGFLGVVKFLEDLGLEDLQTSAYPNGETRLDAYIQTILEGHLDERAPGIGFPSLSELRGILTKLTDYHGNVDRSIQVADRYRRGTASVSEMFTTSNGYVGRTTSQIQPGDDVFIILGCNSPMILRPTSDGEYTVVGSCYLHGAMEGEALLGTLPIPWKVKFLDDERGFNIPKFCNGDSHEIREYDPRLDSIPLPAEWEPIEFQWTRADPNICSKFRNRITGEVINSDPRLFPEALLERGIPVKRITLI
ncbi:HET-domain-containing protein [Xylaria venustula]|nr:HET-domain-containing protein [Xylaria venustula]